MCINRTFKRSYGRINNMKKILIILLTIITSSCSDPEIPSHRLVEDGGIFYEKDSNTPFSGISIKHIDTKLFSKTYFNNGMALKKETFYPSGEPHTIESYMDGDDANSVQVFDKDGEDISDTTYVTYWDNGLVKSLGKYINGRKEDLWENFDLAGNSIKRTYWREGKPSPIVEFKNIELRKNIPFLTYSEKPFTGIIKFEGEKYSGELLQEFKDGRPHGIQEGRHSQDDGGNLYYFDSCTSGLSFNFESTYIDKYDHESHCSESYGEMFNENGDKLYEFFTENGLTTFYYYHENGQISQKGQNKLYGEEGWHKDGLVISYYDNGQVHSKDLYENKIIVSGAKYSISGVNISNGEDLGTTMNEYFKSSGYYLNGLKHGKWTDEYGGYITYISGSAEGPSIKYLYGGCTNEIGSYKNNKKDGMWVEYEYCKESDAPSETIYYSGGEKVADKIQ